MSAAHAISLAATRTPAASAEREGQRASSLPPATPHVPGSLDGKYRYVMHEDVPTFRARGWVIVNEASPYSVLMHWTGDDAP
jgi:hypothetical protein